MKLRIKINERVVSATLNSGETASDFASLLPLTLEMNDLFQREKYAHLPRALSEDAPRTRSYEVGDIAYWSPAHDVAIFYRKDGQAIPAPGLITLGKLDSGADAFDVSGSVRVTIERVE
ncbi:cyclophilin-like fold protein [Polyangium sp. 6x1]|uniref:cyclophilin-like fold protein n=1 Tax=Polyangium sp. 6x1 TaxID=3042689 RepID=UPI002482C5A1|nr:cyclophilin-like fold protein [Polyangium sp. 6x1]MDI1447467.1 cyclophilin-like fold protein [Polyangium sp. 6x1]